MNRKNKVKLNDYKWEIKLNIVYKLIAEQLNNEGNIGNVMKSRTIVDEEGNKRNMISGPSTKHHIRNRLIEVADKKQLCSSCRIFSPLKDGKHLSKEETLSKSGNRTKGCVVCDIMGFMNPKVGEKKTSVIRVSDAIAEATGVRDTQLHSRLDTVESSLSGVEKGEEKISTNMIFHQENRSSSYHQIVQIDLARIAFDDENQCYVTNDKEWIKVRVKNAILSVIKHFLDIEGAQTSSHKPHLIELSGSISEVTDGCKISNNYSSMNTDFLDVERALQEDVSTFSNPIEFKNVMQDLMEDSYLDFVIERNLSFVNENFNVQQ